MRMTRFMLSLVVVAAAVAAAIAQTPGGKPGGGPPVDTAQTATSATTAPAVQPEQNVQQSLQEILEEPSSPEAYHYDPQGRRDPFQSLIGPAPKLSGTGKLPGPPGFLIDEMKLQGIIRTKQQGLIAMVMGPDNKGYLIKIGDRVFDGEVVRITATAVVFRQEVNDPTRIERFREVVKDLSPDSSKK